MRIVSVVIGDNLRDFACMCVSLGVFYVHCQYSTSKCNITCYILSKYLITMNKNLQNVQTF